MSMFNPSSWFPDSRYRFVGRLDDTDDRVYTLAFSPDAKVLASGGTFVWFRRNESFTIICRERRNAPVLDGVLRTDPCPRCRPPRANGGVGSGMESQFCSTYPGFWDRRRIYFHMDGNHGESQVYLVARANLMWALKMARGLRFQECFTARVGDPDKPPTTPVCAIDWQAGTRHQPRLAVLLNDGSIKLFSMTDTGGLTTVFSHHSQQLASVPLAVKFSGPEDGDNICLFLPDGEMYVVISAGKQTSIEHVQACVKVGWKGDHQGDNTVHNVRVQ